MMKPKLNIHTTLNNGIINTSNNNVSNSNLISNSISFIYNIFNRQKYTLQNNSNNLYLNTLPPINLKLISLCLIWYFISSLTSQLTKIILTDFNFPIFIGECQFFISALLSISLIIILINYPILIDYFPKNSVPIAFIQQTNLIINNKLYSSSSSSNNNNNNNINNINININSNSLFFLKNSIYNLPNLFDKNVFRSILPMGFFQFFGKLFSLAATAAVPIATVASIRSLSPLLIVAGYRIYYKVKFPLSTYMSLIPLVLGVVIIVISQAKDHSKSLSHSMTTSAVVGSLDNSDSTGTSTITDTEAAAAAKAAAADAAIAAANSAMTAVVEAGTAVAVKILNKRDNLDQSMPLISSSSDPQVVNSAKLASISDYPTLYMNFSDYLKGLIYASSSALIFAIQSIYAKNIMSTSDLFVNKHNNNRHHNIPNDSFVTTNNDDPQQQQQQHPVNKIKFRSNSISMPSPGSLSLPNADNNNNNNKLNIDSDIQLDEKLSSSSSSLDENQFPNLLPLSENFKKPFPILKPINSSSNLSDYENKNELLINDNKPDKLTVLLYCAIFGFSLSFPIFMIYELPSLLFGKKLIIDNELIDKTIFKIPWGLLILNGFSHFCQALLAFHILGSLPTVTYSIANLMKRIIIMTVSMIMTGKQLTFHEFLGLLHIAIGLYAYDKWGSHKR